MQMVHVFFVSLNGALYLPWKLEFEARNDLTYKLTMFRLFTRESELDVSLVVISIVSSYPHLTAHYMIAYV